VYYARISTSAVVLYQSWEIIFPVFHQTTVNASAVIKIVDDT